MARTGITDYEIEQKKLAKALNLFEFSKIDRYSSSEAEKIERNIKRAITVLENAQKEYSPFFAIEIEKQCINFEYSFFAKNAQEQKRYDKQLSELQSAKASARLVFDPEAYRQHVLDAYGPHRKIMFPPSRGGMCDSPAKTDSTACSPQDRDHFSHDQGVLFRPPGQSSCSP